MPSSLAKPSAIISYLLVGILWGCTNPLIKSAQAAAQQANLSKIKHLSASSSSLSASLSDATSSSTSSPDTTSSPSSDSSNDVLFSNIVNLFKEPSILAPFAVNQLGSFAFYYVLINEPISIAAPVCNSLTFILTALVSHFYLGEEIPSPSFLVMGIIAIITGIYVCITSIDA